MLTLLRRPSAFLPPAISLALMALILAHVARSGLIHEADEGTEAHLFQILMPAQVMIIGYFALKWLPQRRTQALEVLALQAATALAVVGLVFFLRL
ncbi:MAG: hypothetical protein GIW95_03485 [Candidatus Eremiobacteraeota bacterium]|nr:hypothetical protein [Candidatus Eremiobacteraeota bacterium]